MNPAQLTLTPQVRATDPNTSKAAALRVSPYAHTWQARITRVLAKRDATDDELCLALGITERQWPSVKTCHSRMKRAGLVEATGYERNHQQEWRLVRVAKVVVTGGQL